MFDTMVPHYLALVNRVQMLRESFSGRAHIPDRVRGEITGLSHSDSRVEVLLAPLPFAQVHRLDRDGAKRAWTRQVSWYGRSVIEDDPSRDRGEAEAHELCSQDPGWVLVSQDANAIHHGRIMDVPVFAAPDVLLAFAAEGQCMPASAWSIYREMLAAGMYASRYWPDDSDTEARFLDLGEELVSSS
ncbi:MAG: hypothetical protein ACC726_10475 [Chloroflexota bacterium]